MLQSLCCGQVLTRAGFPTDLGARCLMFAPAHQPHPETHVRARGANAGSRGAALLTGAGLAPGPLVVEKAAHAAGKTSL